MNTKVWYLPYFESVYHTRMQTHMFDPSQLAIISPIVQSYVIINRNMLLNMFPWLDNLCRMS